MVLQTQTQGLSTAIPLPSPSIPTLSPCDTSAPPKDASWTSSLQPGLFDLNKKFSTTPASTEALCQRYETLWNPKNQAISFNSANFHVKRPRPTCCVAAVRQLTMLYDENDDFILLNWLHSRTWWKRSGHTKSRLAGHRDASYY